MKNFFSLIAAVFLSVAFPLIVSAAGLLSVTNNNSLDPADIYVLRQDALADGELVNIDRTHLYANLPATMLGHDYIVTANDDKTADPGFSIDVTFDAGTTLLLSIDSRVGDEEPANGPTLGGGVMDWVITQGWTDTGLTWNKANETNPLIPFHVYSLMPTGTSHTFYEQNDGGGRNMYTIAEIPEPSSLVIASMALFGLMFGLLRR